MQLIGFNKFCNVTAIDFFKTTVLKKKNFHGKAIILGQTLFPPTILYHDFTSYLDGISFAENNNY